jgi:hypothetical protein
VVEKNLLREWIARYLDIDWSIAGNKTIAGRPAGIHAAHASLRNDSAANPFVKQHRTGSLLCREKRLRRQRRLGQEGAFWSTADMGN